MLTYKTKIANGIGFVIGSGKLQPASEEDSTQTKFMMVSSKMINYMALVANGIPSQKNISSLNIVIINKQYYIKE
jgi:hypothetical protein